MFTKVWDEWVWKITSNNQAQACYYQILSCKMSHDWQKTRFTELWLCENNTFYEPRAPHEILVCYCKSVKQEDNIDWTTVYDQFNRGKNSIW